MAPSATALGRGLTLAEDLVLVHRRASDKGKNWSSLSSKPRRGELCFSRLWGRGGEEVKP